MDEKIEVVLNIANDAKLNVKSLKPQLQQLHLNIDRETKKKQILLEVDDNLLDEICKNQSTFKAFNLDDSAVFCVGDRIFDVKEASTSNNLLLAPNLQFSDDLKSDVQQITDVDVTAIFQTYLELRETSPKFEQLLKILANSQYKGPEYEDDVDVAKLYNFDQLVDVVKASEKDLKTALDRIVAIKLKSKYRLLEQAYHFEVIELMVKIIDENSWDLNRIRKEETVQLLADFVPEEITSNLFDLYTTKTDLIDGIQFYQYDEERIIKLFTISILKDRKMKITELFNVFTSLVPEDFKISKEMLNGVAVIDQDTDLVWAFHDIYMPDNLDERLKLIFEQKSKWTYLEIAPYLKAFTDTNSDVNVILMKHTRISSINGEKYYSKKY